MQSFENSPLSPTKRLGVSLNVDTGYHGDSNYGKKKGKQRNNYSPPDTPTMQSSKNGNPNNASQSKALRVNTGPRETFLDDITPIDPSLQRVGDADRGNSNRDSHDLSLSPRQVTRDSLVDHMLLSLDQFSFGNDLERQPTVDEEQLYSTQFGDEDHYQPAQNFAPRNAKPSAHNYSYSSDYDQGDDSSRYSSQLSRGRRSHSSSTVPIQSGPGKLHHIRTESIPNSTFNNRGQPVQIPPRGIHSRGGRESKGSSTNSFDLGYAQVTSNQRWAHGLPGRSPSFDHGNSYPDEMDQQHNGSQFSSLDYEAAPTPTVPGGPRRIRPESPIMMPKQQVSQVNSPHKLERKRSTRSSKSAYTSKASLVGGRLDYGLHDKSRELPPLPAFRNEQPAPAPLVGYGKSKDSPAPTPSKERPGFFRRVFGSSRSNSSALAEPPRSKGSTTSAETTDRPNSKTNHIASQVKHTNASPREQPPPPPKEHVPVLTKKPSSFFRRRKKSVSEPEPPMPPPVAVPPIRFQPEVESRSAQSPVSSLRKVMNPYLRSPGKSLLDPQHPQHQFHERMQDSPTDDRNLRSFSPDYEPDKSATIRAVRPDSRDTVEGEELPKKLPTQQVSSQEYYSVAKSGKLGSGGISGDDREATFLQDSSDNDRDGPNSPKIMIDTKENQPPARAGNEPVPSPSVTRDRALVAEYERAHAKRSPAQKRIDLEKSSPVPASPASTVLTPSSISKKSPALKDEDWVMLTPSKQEERVDKETRAWIEPSDSEDDAPVTTSLKPILPKIFAEGIPRNSGSSTDTVYKSATSLLPTLQIDGDDEKDVSLSNVTSNDEPTITPNSPVKDTSVSVSADLERAKKIYDGNEEFLLKDKAATWLGGEGEDRTHTLTAYMELYDFANINILAALRAMCGRLVLKAESQQIDRILQAFAKRWCQCNPNHGFKVTGMCILSDELFLNPLTSLDVVHTICYTLLLLNTDLHLADIDQKMTRSQFVKNAMPTIRQAAASAAPEMFDQNRPSILPGKSATFDSDVSAGKPSTSRTSLEAEKPSWRHSFLPPSKSELDALAGKVPTPLDYDTPVDDCGPLVKAPFHGTIRTWEVQVEIVLKDFYNSIKNDRLPLFGAPIEKASAAAQSSNSLSVFTNGMLRRTPSVLSKAASEAPSYARGRTADAARSNTGKWANKNRSRPRLYPNSGMGSSRTSLDDGASSMWSPSVSSSTWSKYSLGKTQTSMSVDSFGSNWPNAEYQQSIGFANALSQAIIREETTVGPVGSIGSGPSEDLRAAPLLEDESLELAGAPWAKEGIVKHKKHLDAVGKKNKDRNWNEVFAVIEKGYMSLFSFSSKSMRNKSKGKASGGVVGGGNWQDNAENLGAFLLRQTIASALPSPGYSKARPHVWALSLPTGAVHLFQVGSPEIVKEYVSTANYWSARLSNHPLVGGISNIEYGWSDAIVNNALVAAINESTERRPSTSAARPSLQSSLRSSLDQGSNTMRSRLPGDKISISDWTPPTQSMRSSNLMEADQLKTLSEYVAGIEDDLQKHNRLRSSMLLAFTPRHPNSVKAMGNWETKSAYLLHEIVKFRTYIDVLKAAETSKQRVYAERGVPEIPEDLDVGDVTLKAEQ